MDRGEEKSEQWFLIALHTCENLALILASRWAYLTEYPLTLIVIQISLLTVNMAVLVLSLLKKTLEDFVIWSFLILLVLFNLVVVFLPSPGLAPGLIIMDVCIITLNTLAVAVSTFYVTRVELYAGLPHTFPILPSFGPEVRQIT